MMLGNSAMDKGVQAPPPRGISQLATRVCKMLPARNYALTVTTFNSSETDPDPLFSKRLAVLFFFSFFLFFFLF